MLQFLFLILFFLILALFSVLTLPYHYLLTFDYRQNLKLRLSFSVLFFKLNFDIRDYQKELYLKIFNFKIKLPLKNYSFKIRAHSKAVVEKIKNNKSELDLFTLIDLMKSKNIRIILKFIQKIISHLKPEFFKLNLLLSFSDPYYNGLLLAYYYTLNELLRWQKITMTVNWQRPCFNADGKIGGRIVPIKIFFIFLNFIFSIQSLKILRQLYKSN